MENWRKRIAEMLRDALFQRVVCDYLGDGQADSMLPKLPNTSAIRILWWKKSCGRWGSAHDANRSSWNCGEVAGGSQQVLRELGLEVMPEETVEAEKVRLAMVPVGESRIELLEPTSPDSAIAKFLEKRGEGLHHVALHVNDLSAHRGTTEGRRHPTHLQRDQGRRRRTPLRLRASVECRWRAAGAGGRRAPWRLTMLHCRD